MEAMGGVRDDGEHQAAADADLAGQTQPIAE